MGERSGLCHGPHCQRPIDPRSPSEDFCTDECQTRWHAEANGSAPVGVIQRDGLYFLETDFDRDAAWRNIMRRYAWLVDPSTVRIRPRLDYHNPVRRRERNGEQPPTEPAARVETGGEALSRAPKRRRWFR